MSRSGGVAVCAVLLAVLALSGCSDGRVEPVAGAGSEYVAGGGVVTVVDEDQRVPAPAFSGPLLDGGDYDLADSVGSVVVLNVWGSWCAPCRAEAPDLQAVHEDTAGDGVEFVGVNTRDSETSARAFEQEYQITYPSVFDPDGAALLAFRDTLPASAIPSTLVVDRSGRMAARVIGPVDADALSDLVRSIAAEPTESTA